MPTLAFWIDVDNTLLDNDKIKQDQNEFLQVELGPELTQHYWDLYEEIRQEQGVVDIPLTVRRLRERIPLDQMHDYTYRHVESMFVNFPFPNALFAGSLDTLRYLNTIGTPIIISDGDLNYQAEKIVNSSISEGVGGRVMLFKHKQEHLDAIMQRYPADHYVMIDDKPQILYDIKRLKGDQVTTVFVKQGKYAQEAFPASYVPDITVANIGDVRTISQAQFFETTKA